MQNIARIALLLAAATVACSDSGSSTGDMAHDAALDMTKVSACGHVGDTGNALGVGKYCTSGTDCTGLTASICSAIQNSGGPEDTYFCTKICTGPTDTSCGTNAVCACQGACGCTPAMCITPSG
jgi:hypothetical protein